MVAKMAICLNLRNLKVKNNEIIISFRKITNIHNRYDENEGQRILIFLSESDYTTANADITAKIADSNVLDYVNVYTPKR